jgi:hypothetical protein
MKWALPLLLAAAAWGQTRYPHHNLTLNLGGVVGLADLARYTEPSTVLGGGYGYRFHRNFQADIGLDTAFGAARVRDFLNTSIGIFRIKDRQYFVPMGARAILPFGGGKAMAYGGGGFAYMRYSEVLRQPSSYYRIDCPDCASRSGWGYYSQTGFSVFVDRARMFRLGLGARMYRGHTEGLGLGNLPGVRTRDRWVSGLVELGVSF